MDFNKIGKQWRHSDTGFFARKEEIQKQPFWLMPISDVLDFLHTDIENGLSEDEAQKRLDVFGLNIIEKTKTSPTLYIFLKQFESPLILILLFAGVVTFFIEHYLDMFFILAAVLANATLGFYQEYKAEKALSELKTYLKQRSRVIRNGIEKEIDSADIVPGDIIRLTQGDRVPADGRIVFVNDFQVDEAVLTGESLPVSKSVDQVVFGAVLGDQSSMVFAGTLVTQGVATVVVCRTDFFTEFGKIAVLVSGSEKEETPLQKSIRHFSSRAGIFLGILTLIIFITGVALGHSKIDMFLTSVAIAVSAVPEGLPIAMTVILAVGVERMAKRKGVIRKLVAAEALGNATIILTDKTGTLTEAKMELDEVYPLIENKEEKILKDALLGTNVLIENKNDFPTEWRMSGKTLEVALVRSSAVRGINIDEVKSKNNIINSLPFNAVNKFSVSLIKEEGKHFLVFLGAPDVLVHYSSLSDIEKNEILEKINSLASAGQLVVGVARKEIFFKEDFSFSKDLDAKGLSLGGLITLHDPIRPNVKQAIHDVELAGIKTIIVTGDHKGTAEAVAKGVGIPVREESVLDVVDLRKLSDEELKERLRNVRVVSRVSPSDKMRIVKMFQEMGEVVAMTGDGVNDAPGIKQADIGVAMGSGTEVARSVADLVILDDNFETIAVAVSEGRHIISNIKKVIVYLLSDTADELFLIGGAIIAGVALPLNALQILYVNFFSDSFPAIAFAFEKNTDGFSGNFYRTRKGLFDPLMRFLIIFIGISTSALLFVIYWIMLKAGLPEDLVKTFIFASFGSYTLFLAFSIKSLEKSIFEYSVFSNPYLVAGVGIGIFLIFMAIYVPFLQSILGTVALPLNWLLGVLLIGALNILAVEIGKWFFRSRKKA